MEPLSQAIQSEGFNNAPVMRKLQLALQIASGLDYLHTREEPVVHSDIKRYDWAEGTCHTGSFHACNWRQWLFSTPHAVGRISVWPACPFTPDCMQSQHPVGRCWRCQTCPTLAWLRSSEAPRRLPRDEQFHKATPGSGLHQRFSFTVAPARRQMFTALPLWSGRSSPTTAMAK